MTTVYSCYTVALAGCCAVCLGPLVKVVNIGTMLHVLLITNSANTRHCDPHVMMIMVVMMMMIPITTAKRVGMLTVLSLGIAAVTIETLFLIIRSRRRC